MAEFTELLKALPALIWSLVGAVALWLLRSELPALLRRIDSFEGAGIKVSLKALAEAAQLRHVALDLAGPAGARLKDRLERQAKRLAGAEILWVDDRPSGNRHEADVFIALGARITFAASTAEVQGLLAGRPERFDLVLSDWERGDDRNAGPALLAELRDRGNRMPLVFYVGQDRDLPRGAQGLTRRPDELVDLVLDALKCRG